MAAILFRCDASDALGAGHAMRCLALADAMAAQGDLCTFATNPGAQGLVPGLRRHRCWEAPVSRGLEEGWLTAGRLQEFSVVVVDHYGLDAKFETRCRRAGLLVLVIDDLANRAHDCDLLVDPTLGRRPTDYARHVPADARLLLGPCYALLRPQFVARREKALTRRGLGAAARNILVSLGGSDPHGMVVRLLPPLLQALPDVRVDVVASGLSVDRSFPGAVETSERVTVHYRVDDMAALMVAADLAVGAAGGMSWERAVLGLPAAIVVTAANQRANAAALEAAGAAVQLGDALDLNPVVAAGKIAALAQSPDRLAAASHAASALCDGLGCQRLLNSLVSMRANTPAGDPAKPSVNVLRLVPAAPEHEAITYQFQCEPGARTHSLDPRVPTRAEHSLWYKSALESQDRQLMLLVNDGEIVGTIRFDKRGDGLEVSVLLAAKARGQGMGRQALRLARSMFRNANLMARVRISNRTSLKAFQSAGFVVSQEDAVDGVVVLDCPGGRAAGANGEV